MGVLCSEKACLYAVASRNLEKAKEFADKYGAVVSYGSYEEMLKDTNVDLVYICTPNTFHYEQKRYRSVYRIKLADRICGMQILSVFCIKRIFSTG